MSENLPLHAPFAGTVIATNRGLEAITDPAERHEAYEAAVAAAYEKGKGLNMAACFEIDDVIDPADSRRWIATLVDDHDAGDWRKHPGKRRPSFDAW